MRLLQSRRAHASLWLLDLVLRNLSSCFAATSLERAGQMTCPPSLRAYAGNTGELLKAGGEGAETLREVNHPKVMAGCGAWVHLTPRALAIPAPRDERPFLSCRQLAKGNFTGQKG